MEENMVYLLLSFVAGVVITASAAAILMSKTNKKTRAATGSLANALQGKESVEQALRESAEKQQQQLQILLARQRELEQSNSDLQARIAEIQKHDAETEALLQAGQPVIHSLKLKLIEANNTISRYKAKLGQLNND